MRHLLRGYADGGATVLLSSHLLHEIEVIADDLIVIGNGRIVAHGTKQELLATAGTVVTTRHPGTLRTALDNAGLDHSPTASPHQPSGGRDDVPVALRVEAEPETVGRVAQQTGVALMELTHADSTGLEEMFLQLTAENSREGTHR
jgi:ABC-2 type transport system ATP-binding protein